MPSALSTRILRTLSSRRRRSTTVVAAICLLACGALVGAVPAAAHHRVLASHGPAAHTCANASSPATQLASTELRAALVCLINAERAADGLPPLHVSSQLNRTAQAWTDNMVLTHEFDHGDLDIRVRSAGVNFASVGENIATGFLTPQASVRAWMASTDHCRNILSPLYTEVGTGVSSRPVTGYASTPATWTLDFALPAGQQPPSHNSGPADACPY